MFYSTGQELVWYSAKIFTILDDYSFSSEGFHVGFTLVVYKTLTLENPSINVPLQKTICLYVHSPCISLCNNNKDLYKYTNETSNQMKLGVWSSALKLGSCGLREKKVSEWEDTFSYV